MNISHTDLLVIEKQETIKQSLKDRFAKVPQDRSLADELITERREAAKLCK